MAGAIDKLHRILMARPPSVEGQFESFAARVGQENMGDALEVKVSPEDHAVCLIGFGCPQIVGQTVRVVRGTRILQP